VNHSAYILIVGGSDTGREPVTAALLRRRLARTGLDWRVTSAGVTGHDDEPADPEARNAMLAFELDISEHRARSVTAGLIEAAAVLIAIDSGIARVLSAYYPQTVGHIYTIGQLAGVQRDIPDPFRMQMGVWVHYAQEIDQLLAAGMPRLVDLLREYNGGELTIQSQSESQNPTEPPPTEPPRAMEPAAPDTPDAPDTPVLAEPAAPDTPDAPDTPVLAELAAPDTLDAPAVLDELAATAGPASSRQAQIERCERLLDVLEHMPDLIAWPQARSRLADEIRAAGTIQLAPEDLAQSYSALLLALLDMRATPPGASQCATLRAALQRLHQPIDQHALTELSATLPTWTTP
jgi:protein-tyrosine-phosphatase